MASWVCMFESIQTFIVICKVLCLSISHNFLNMPSFQFYCLIRAYYKNNNLVLQSQHYLEKTYYTSNKVLVIAEIRIKTYYMYNKLVVIAEIRIQSRTIFYKLISFSEHSKSFLTRISFRPFVIFYFDRYEKRSQVHLLGI